MVAVATGTVVEEMEVEEMAEAMGEGARAAEMAEATVAEMEEGAMAEAPGAAAADSQGAGRAAARAV